VSCNLQDGDVALQGRHLHAVLNSQTAVLVSVVSS